MPKITKKTKGFTLIEILVVIGLIAILAAVVLIAINPARQFKQARDSQRQSNVNAILNAIGQYVADHKGDLPGNITSTKQDISDAGDLCADLLPDYLPLMPVDPENGDPLKEADCDDTVGYDVSKDSNGRITVYADGEITSNIEVTR